MVFLPQNQWRRSAPEKCHEYQEGSRYGGWCLGTDGIAGVVSRYLAAAWWTHLQPYIGGRRGGLSGGGDAISLA